MIPTRPPRSEAWRRWRAAARDGAVRPVDARRATREHSTAYEHAARGRGYDLIDGVSDREVAAVVERMIHRTVDGGAVGHQVGEDRVKVSERIEGGLTLGRLERILRALRRAGAEGETPITIRRDRTGEGVAVEAEVDLSAEPDEPAFVPDDPAARPPKS